MALVMAVAIVLAIALAMAMTTAHSSNAWQRRSRKRMLHRAQRLALAKPAR